MVENPELEEFKRLILSLKRNASLKPHLRGDVLRLRGLPVEDIARLLRETSKVAYYFFIAAAGLNRTTLKKAMTEPEARIVAKEHRQAHVIRQRLPHQVSFEATANTAVALRSNDLGRKGRGQIEQLFRDRLKQEGIPILMSPPARPVPALLVPRRKPDGVEPDPTSGEPPRTYLEIKNIKRVADDIQKRLYELAEASLEMKLIYGDLKLTGLGVKSTLDVSGNSALHAKIRRQIVKATPVVVGLFLCPKAEAERYRAGAETFIDRVFFQEEIEECLDFLKACTRR